MDLKGETHLRHQWMKIENLPLTVAEWEFTKIINNNWLREKAFWIQTQLIGGKEQVRQREPGFHVELESEFQLTQIH